MYPAYRGDLDIASLSLNVKTREKKRAAKNRTRTIAKPLAGRPASVTSSAVSISEDESKEPEESESKKPDIPTGQPFSFSTDTSMSSTLDEDSEDSPGQ